MGNTKININGVVTANVIFFKYANGRKGFKLVDNNGGYLGRCTVNFEEIKYNNDNEVIIKDHGDNTGMYKALLNARFIKPHHKKIRFGLNQAMVCYLNENYEYKQ